MSQDTFSVRAGQASERGHRSEALRPWLPIIASLALLYLPTLYDLFRGLWRNEEQMHGPLVLSLACWLLYRNWPQMMARSAGAAPSALGWPPFVLGLLLYALGRSQEIQIFEVASAIFLLVGIVLRMRGVAALKAQWFPLFFMLFMVPLPGPLVDAVTMPMKMAVSFVTERLLFDIGYPIGRSGVVLQIGVYKLLVADACAGLHTLFTLEAMGLLYLNLVQRDSFFRNVGLALLIVPISFCANVIRVMVLTLVTYYLGDAAGQGFLHGLAGLVLVLSAMFLIICVDSLLHFAERVRHRRAAPA
jgi:exosortase B